ncbi:helix-turn-helix transcriptional regulator [Paenibacillus humicola]|uniref:helix-turn-helix transcriptional regulator n=1 Tax=Paenibacillus humicola TaxID=3110540 RepID=UPI00237BF10D|nr:AraC family transcriptional regulator [Paenibacillus humicola]
MNSRYRSILSGRHYAHLMKLVNFIRKENKQDESSPDGSTLPPLPGNTADCMPANRSDQLKRVIQEAPESVAGGKFPQEGETVGRDEEAVSFSGDCYRLPPDLLAQLADRVKNGDRVHTERVLDLLCHQNLESGRLAPVMVKWFFLDLQCTLLKLLDSAHVDFRDIFPLDPDPVSMLTEAATAEILYARTKAMYIKACSFMRGERTDRNERMVQAIIRFIEEHYGDNKLSLSMISEAMGLSPVYISSFFKKYSGENITDFIMKTRMKHAKRLLEQNLTVQEIAAKVGYANNIVLTRAFKRMEGITPGSYRQNLKHTE